MMRSETAKTASAEQTEKLQFKINWEKGPRRGVDHGPNKREYPRYVIDTAIAFDIGSVHYFQ